MVALAGDTRIRGDRRHYILAYDSAHNYEDAYDCGVYQDDYLDDMFDDEDDADGDVEQQQQRHLMGGRPRDYSNHPYPKDPKSHRMCCMGRACLCPCALCGSVFVFLLGLVTLPFYVLALPFQCSRVRNRGCGKCVMVRLGVGFSLSCLTAPLQACLWSCSADDRLKRLRDSNGHTDTTKHCDEVCA